MYTIERTVGNSHIGADGNIKISAVVDLFQDCCGFQLDCCPVTQEFYRRCNAVTFLLFRQLDFIRDVGYGQKVTIGTEVFQMKSTYGMRNTIMWRGRTAPYSLLRRRSHSKQANRQTRSNTERSAGHISSGPEIRGNGVSSEKNITAERP